MHGPLKDAWAPLVCAPAPALPSCSALSTPAPAPASSVCSLPAVRRPAPGQRPRGISPVLCDSAGGVPVVPRLSSAFGDSRSGLVPLRQVHRSRVVARGELLGLCVLRKEGRPVLPRCPLRKQDGQWPQGPTQPQQLAGENSTTCPLLTGLAGTGVAHADGVAQPAVGGKGVGYRCGRSGGGASCAAAAAAGGAARPAAAAGAAAGWAASSAELAVRAAGGSNGSTAARCSGGIQGQPVCAALCTGAVGCKRVPGWLGHGCVTCSPLPLPSHGADRAAVPQIA